VIISYPEKFPDRVLFVGTTSWNAREDHACVLQSGEHSTVTHRTCITYSRGNAKASDAELDALVKSGLLEVFEPLSDAVLERIRTGAMESTRTPKEFKRMLIEQSLVDDPDAPA
jgi:hypothetical protein